MLEIPVLDGWRLAYGLDLETVVGIERDPELRYGHHAAQVANAVSLDVALCNVDQDSQRKAFGLSECWREHGRSRRVVEP